MLNEEAGLSPEEAGLPVIESPHTLARAPMGRWRRLADDLLCGRGMVGLLTVLVMGVLLLLGIAAMWPQPASDAAKYGCYVYAFWHGGAEVTARPADFPGCAFLAGYAASMPLHTLPREYPLLALVPFSLPLLLPLAWYPVAFAVEMVLVAAGIFGYLARVGRRGAPLAFALLVVLGCWGTAAGRFDLVPAVMTLLCLIAAERGQFRRAYVWLAIATLLKLYPLPLLLPLFLAEQRAQAHPLLHWRRWTGVGVFAGTCAAGVLVSLLVSVSGTLGPLNYFTDRPIQIESFAASLLWGASLLGVAICTDVQFGSLNVYEQVQGVCTAAGGYAPGPLTQGLSRLLLALLIAGILLVAWMQWRGKLTLPQAFVALLLVVMLTGKVFSPQYLIWLAPLVAYTLGLDLAWLLLWGAVSLLTTVIYPYLYSATYRIADVPSLPAFYPMVALRNACFALAVVGYLFDLWRLRSRPGQRPAPRGRAARATLPPA